MFESVKYNVVFSAVQTMQINLPITWCRLSSMCQTTMCQLWCTVTNIWCGIQTIVTYMQYNTIITTVLVSLQYHEVITKACNRRACIFNLTSLEHHISIWKQTFC